MFFHALSRACSAEKRLTRRREDAKEHAKRGLSLLLVGALRGSASMFGVRRSRDGVGSFAEAS